MLDSQSDFLLVRLIASLEDVNHPSKEKNATQPLWTADNSEVTLSQIQIISRDCRGNGGIIGDLLIIIELRIMELCVLSPVTPTRFARVEQKT